MGHKYSERNQRHDNVKELWCPGERKDQKSYTAIMSGDSTIEQTAVKVW